MRRIIVFFLTVLTLMCVSCRPENLIWTGTYNFPGGEWKPNDMVVFAPDTTFVVGLSSQCSAVLSIRYSDNASVETLPIVAECESPEAGEYWCDTLAIEILKVPARSADKARLGVFETVDTIPLRSQPTPGWSLALHPALPFLSSENETNVIKGLYSITFEILNSSK